ncbi:MAG TPA: isocitrate/isopropylmalate dehydrogenase family protein [Myxococcota bacterium]|nr:isocitrate/isopropylmalate dehydrogenase family protein [Myxococcota bacterium]
MAPDLTYEHFDLGADRYLRDGTTLPESVLQRFRNEFDAVYLGAFGDPRVPNNEHAKEILLGMRFRLDLYINFRPCKLLDDRYCPLRGKGRKEVNFVVFRENTEGMYTGIGGQFKRDSEDEIAIEQEINTRKGVERILRAAFDYARANGKKRVCMSDKANAMRHGHELWQRVYKRVAKDYPEIQASHLYVDVAAMKMVQTPEAFDVIVTNNLFGDILTDLGSALIGGLGLAASANINPGVAAMFEPVHGSAPDIAGKDLANPLAAMLTASLMLEHLGRKEAAARVEEAVRRCLEDGAVTRELGGNLGTAAAGDAVLARL